MRLRSLHEASKAARTATASWIRTELGATKPASIVNVWQCVCVWLMDSHVELCCQLPDYLPSLEIAKAIISIVAVAVAGVARPLEPVGEVAKVVVGHCSRGCAGGGRRRRQASGCGRRWRREEAPARRRRQREAAARRLWPRGPLLVAARHVHLDTDLLAFLEAQVLERLRRRACLHLLAHLVRLDLPLHALPVVLKCRVEVVRVTTVTEP
mmetsp:Transcript_15855/g.33914  ORF Transcript_15855/g.33914 Transcript_15855/m.33914 type:complete len:211 (-) Transcript_15855:639-1271(-)